MYIYMLVWFWNHSPNHSLNCSLLSPITTIILSRTKFYILIGSLGAYMSRNQHTTTWVSNYRNPVWTFYNWRPEIRCPCDLNVNYTHFNGFFRNALHSFQNLWSVLQMFLLKRSSQKTTFNPEICYRSD